MVQLLITFSGMTLILAFVVYKFIKFTGKQNTQRKWDEYLSLTPQKKAKIMYDGSVQTCTIIEKNKAIGYTAYIDGKIIKFTFGEFIAKCK